MLDNAQRRTRSRARTLLVLSALFALATAATAHAETLKPKGWSSPKMTGSAHRPTTTPSANPSFTPEGCCMGNDTNVPGHAGSAGMGYHQNQSNKGVVHYFWTEVKVQISFPRRVEWWYVPESGYLGWKNVGVGDFYYPGDTTTSPPTQADVDAAEPDDADEDYPVKLVISTYPVRSGGDAGNDYVKIEAHMLENCTACPSSPTPVTCSGDYCIVDWAYLDSAAGGVDVSTADPESSCTHWTKLFEVTDENEHTGETTYPSTQTTADIEFTSYLKVEEKTVAGTRCGGRSWAWPLSFEVRYYHDSGNVPLLGGTGLSVKGVSVGLDDGLLTTADVFPDLNDDALILLRGEDKLCPGNGNAFSYCGQ